LDYWRRICSSFPTSKLKTSPTLMLTSGSCGENHFHERVPGYCDGSKTIKCDVKDMSKHNLRDPAMVV